MSEQTIAPCPICGGSARPIQTNAGTWSMWCDTSGCLRGPVNADRAAVIAAWNRLSGHAARIAELEAHITIDNGLLNRTRLLLSDLLQGMRPLPTTYMRELQTDIEAWRTGRLPK